MTPRVSIITPVFNGARTIGAAIDSVRVQSEPSWEHVVVDDGSTDSTAAIVEAIGEPRLRSVRQAHAGRSAARNHGLELAGGEFVLFLDADDWLLPNALRDHLELLEREPVMGASISDGWFCRDDGTPIASFSSRRDPVEPGDVFAQLVANPGLIGAPLAAMVRAAAVRRYGIRFDPALTIGEDTRFFIELARHVRFGVITSDTCRYRWHADNTTLRTSAAQYRVELWRALGSVPALGEFAQLPLAVRERFYHRALVELLADRPEEQAQVADSAPFAALPVPARARLLRLAASEHLLAARHADAAALVQRAAALAPHDATVAVLRALMAVNPRLARLALKVRRLAAWRRTSASAPDMLIPAADRHG
jgi:glycosyltransferase involved in cell wall biosynthesis